MSGDFEAVMGRCKRQSAWHAALQLAASVLAFASVCSRPAAAASDMAGRELLQQTRLGPAVQFISNATSLPTAVSSASLYTSLTLVVSSNLTLTMPADANGTLLGTVRSGTQVILVGICRTPAAGGGTLPTPCRVDAAGLGRFFLVEPGATLAVYDITFANGAALNSSSQAVYGTNALTGGGVLLGGTPQSTTPSVGLFVRVAFTGNTANTGVNGFGGAASLSPYATASFINCSFVGNTASNKGAGVYVAAYASVVFDNSVFASNVATEEPDVHDQFMAVTRPGGPMWPCNPYLVCQWAAGTGALTLALGSPSPPCAYTAAAACALPAHRRLSSRPPLPLSPPSSWSQL